MKLLAVIVELNSTMKTNALEAWKRLKDKQSISFISDNSPCPHFMLLSGVSFDRLSQLRNILNELASEHPRCQIKGNGIGIFVRDTPVIHIRWNICPNITSLQQDILCQLCNEVDQNWVAKSSLAYKDSSYESLNVSLGLLSDLDFESYMHVESIAIYRIETGRPEKKLYEFMLNKLEQSS
ncbi:hypothetical protein [Colwellia sp. MB02u-14]|uniref:hypothetical protein n=1 Tax=Colwellia sp. MB02u-14 TaxID=2759815 RepID=UPI0015F6942E|nr:hypothetical protein [Colwellia sp. MB02u-14]MBA6302935.1 hypothetical protein [Colwellia sp. MB02u-14]